MKPTHTTQVIAYHLGDHQRKINATLFPSLKAASDHFGKNYLTFSAQICRAIAKGWRCEGYLWERVPAAE